MFQQVGAAAYKPGLDTTIKLCELSGNPQERFTSIHIAGTNGKGSCSHLLASILQEKGLKTGLFTSPHLKDFRERIKVNGRMIGKQRVISYINKYERDYAALKPTFFELTFGMAMQHFSRENVDIAVIETGMGGRLDSTNILKAPVGIITNIGYDHMAYLGNTLQQIASEKAGIIKPGMKVVIGETNPTVSRVFTDAAQQAGSKLLFADTLYTAKRMDPEGSSGNSIKLAVTEAGYSDEIVLECPLGGWYQQKNAATVMAAIRVLNEAGYGIKETDIKHGFKNVIRNTGLMGRWQVLSEKPLTICDTAHNEAGIRYITEQLKATPHKKLHIVFGMLEDKDRAKILKLLPRQAIYYFCKPGISRGLDEVILQETAARAGLRGKAYGSVKEALEAARQYASEEDLIFAGGSTFVVAEIV